jgi:hypothetical protein
MDFILLDSHLRLTSDHPEFSNFIKNFTGLQTGDTNEKKPDIYVNLNLNDNFQISKNHRQISRSIWIENSSVFISEIERFPGLKLKARTEQNRLYIDAFLSNTSQRFVKKIILSVMSNRKHKELQLIGLLYYIIFIPFFYYLERFRSLFLLHASAIKYYEKGVILSGLGGIGKSTFSLGTLLLKGCSFISDNLIFYDYNKIYSCPEPIALDTRSIAMLKNITNFLIPNKLNYSHGRMLYQIKPEALSLEAMPKYLFWLQRGAKNKIISIDKETCIHALLNINLLANEIREYYMLASAFDLAFPCSLSATSYFERLSSLLSNVDCYVLQFKAGDNIKTVLNETIGKIIL